MKPSECENVAKKSRMSVTLEKKMEVIRRMGDGQTRLNVCKSVKLLQWNVSSKMTSVDKIKQYATVSATPLGYSRSKHFQNS